MNSEKTYDLYNYNLKVADEISINMNKISKSYLIAKRFIDIAVSFFGIILSAPLFLIVAVTVKLTSRGSAIYRHKRIGYHGKEINILKFRTMVSDAHDINKYFTPEKLTEYEREFKLTDDPRITKIGKALRETSLDELPQLINILKGDMSIVGPRPIVEKELDKYGVYANDYLSVKPGLTGMWQVHGRSSTTYQERIMLDRDYVQNMSLTNDLKLMLQTVTVVLSKKGAV